MIFKQIRRIDGTLTRGSGDEKVPVEFNKNKIEIKNTIK